MLQHECASYGDASALAGYAWTQAGAAYGTVQVTPQQEQDVLQAYLPMVKRVVRQLASQAMDVMDQSDMDPAFAPSFPGLLYLTLPS